MMLIGGSIAAPVSAWLVRRFDDRALGTAVGALIILLNVDRLLLMLGMAPEFVTSVRVMVVAASAVIVGVLIVRGRAQTTSGLPQPA